MKLFNRVNRLDFRKTKEFEAINNTWYRLKLNQAWTIGSVQSLINKNDFKTFESWEKHYLLSGEKRESRLRSIGHSKSYKLRDLMAPYTNPYHYKTNLLNEDVDINTDYGRTLGELYMVSRFLHSNLNGSNCSSKISEDLCFNFVYIQVIDETYMKIERKIHTLKKLIKLFPDFDFKPTAENVDRAHAIDIEVYFQGRLIAGFQVNSHNYRDKEGFYKTKNSRQERYKKIYDVPVIRICSTTHGCILNPDGFDFLNASKKKQ